MNTWTAQSRLQRDRHQAFTLVELLVVISIITLIASMTLFTLYGVREDTKERRARSQVARVHELIMQQYESYRVRAVPMIDPAVLGMDPRFARLFAIRELMRMEMPDRKNDLLSPVNDLPAGPADLPRFLKSRPALWRAYVRRARQQIIGHNGLPPAAPASQIAWKDDVAGWTPLHQHAECLYLILASMRDGDTTGLDFFTESEIGDVDNDGMPEILDPWGVPIYFLRWAPGFISDLQPGDIDLATDGNAGLGNGDPFDPLKLDPRWTDTILYNDPHLLFPLIISAGRDQQFDILVDFLDTPFPIPLVSNLDYNNPPSATPPQVNLFNDPYVTFEHPTLIDPLWGNVVQIGRPADVNGDGVAGYADNITNHFLEVR